MLEYEWGNSAPLLFSDDGTTPINTNLQHHHPEEVHARHVFDPFANNPFHDPAATNNTTTNTLLPSSSTSTSSSQSPYSHFNTFYNHHQTSQTPQFHSFPDPRVFSNNNNTSSYPTLPPPLPPTVPSILSLDTLTQSTPQLTNCQNPTGGGGSYLMLPKQEPTTMLDYSTPNRIGLNLGGRTYFGADDDFVNRLYRHGNRASADSTGIHAIISNSPKCQAEGCQADLSHAKHYHRRHKVCEFHSKASTVIAAGLTQRFCQQCSRFHLLTEFDNGKRSCRRRLADHNRRRRKSNQIVSQESRLSQGEQNSRSKSSSETPQISPSDSGIHSTSSVTVAVSPPRMSLDSFKQNRPSTPYSVLLGTNTSSSTNFASSTSMFYSTTA